MARLSDTLIDTIFDGRYRIVRSEGGVSLAATPARVPGRALAGSTLEDVAADVGLDDDFWQPGERVGRGDH